MRTFVPILLVLAACPDGGATTDGLPATGPDPSTSESGPGTSSTATEDTPTTGSIVSTTTGDIGTTTEDADTTASDTTGPADHCGGCPPDAVCDPANGCVACDGPGSCPDAILHAAPDGVGDECTYFAPCSLAVAQSRVRALNDAMTADILVYLFGGTYALDAPWTLDAADSGSNGHAVVWRAMPGELPRLSGGIPITGWRLVDAQKNVHRAATGGAFSRQLIVGGVRAIRARGPDIPPGAGWVETATGYTAPDASMAAWAHPTAVELVAHRYWRSFRCPVAAIDGMTITMAAKCWADAQFHKPFDMELPTWVENAPELLDEPGEFYIDRVAGTVDYIPRDGEVLATAGVVLPVQEALLVAAGTVDAPVHHLRFEGLTFTESTWLTPSSELGYVDLQAGVRLVGQGSYEFETTPAAIRFTGAHDITLSGCTFSQLGSTALSFADASHDNHVVGNRFTDISSGAIMIGDVADVDDHHPGDPALVVRDHEIRSNFITRTGRDYPSTVAVWAGYTTRTRVEHNDLFDLPYTAISVGWGWGSVDPPNWPTPSSSMDNHVVGNRIGYFMRVLEDGGGIYTLGAQMGSSIERNYLHNQGNPYGSLYLDNGTQFYGVTENLVEKADHWLLCTTYVVDAENNVITDNYAEFDNIFVQPEPPNPNNTIADNTFVGGDWPPGAMAIAAQSGLEGEYRAYHPDELARGRAVTTSSDFDADHAGPLANDGDGRTGWSPQAPPGDKTPWWQVDLGAEQPLAGVEVVFRWELDQPETRRNIEIVGANQADASDAVVLAHLGATPMQHRAIWSVRLDDPASYRYVRIRKAGEGYLYLGEVRVLVQP